MAALPENDRITGPFLAYEGQTDFPADFPLLRAEGVRLRRVRGGEATEFSGPALSVVNQTSGGFTCRLADPAAAGDQCWVYSRLAASRMRQHTPNGAVRTPTLEADAVELQAQLQEHGALISRAVTLPLGEAGGELPPAPNETVLIARRPDGALTYVSPVDVPSDLVLATDWRQVLADDPANFASRPDGTPAARPLGQLLGNGYDKAPLLDWTGRRVLWLGTSIPHQGAGIDGYPELVGRQMGCASVVNNAWSGSHAGYSGEAAYAGLTTPLARIAHIVALSMTEWDRAAGEALYGPGSAYAPGFDVVTSAVEQTCDYRIRAPFAAAPVDVVVLDHSHNDRDRPTGTLTPPALNVVGVAKGAVTTVTTAGLNDLTVGDGVAVRVAGIAKLAYAAGRVLSVDAGTQSFTLGIDSSAYAGAATGGVAFRLDRNTVYGAFEFLIHYIYWSALDAGAAPPTIILASAPSEFTGDAYSASIYANARLLQALADKWGLALFDAATALKITAKQNHIFLPDAVHPTTLDARRAIANHWVQWLSGGAVGKVTPQDYIQRAAGSLIDGREIEYSRWMGGAGTPSFIVSGQTPLVVEDFASIADWTPIGAATVVNAPWNPAVKAMRAASVEGAQHGVARLGLDPQTAISLSFDLYLPQTVDLAPAGVVRQATLAKIETPSGAWLALNLVVVQERCTLQIGVFGDDADGAFRTYEAAGFPLQATTRHRVHIEAVKRTASRSGALMLYIDDQPAFTQPIVLDDAAVPASTILALGVIFTNLAAFTAFFGDLTYSALTVPDYDTRYTGDLIQPDGATLSVVNGKLIKVLPGPAPVSRLRTFTAAQIASAAHAVNTASKQPGVQVWDATNHRLMVTEGATAAAPWFVADGSITVTPA